MSDMDGMEKARERNHASHMNKAMEGKYARNMKKRKKRYATKKRNAFDKRKRSNQSRMTMNM